MFNNVVLTLLLLSNLMCVKSSKIYDFVYLFGGTTINIGTPEQSLYGTLISSTDRTLVLNTKCGQRENNCPSYCSDSKLNSMYCNPLCRLNIRAEDCKVGFSRNNYGTFDPDNSTTFRSNNKQWIGKFVGTQWLYGKGASDVITFKVDDHRENDLIIKDVEFVSIFMGDTRIFGFMNSISIGLAPGPQNFIMQIYKQQLIPKPMYSYIPYLKLPSAGSIIFGDYDNSQCTDWHFHPTINNSWTIEVNEVIFNGQGFGPSKVAFALEESFFFVKNQIIDDLLDEGILDKNNKVSFKQNYKVDCDADLTMSLVFDKHVVSLTKNDLMLLPDSRVSCTSLLNAYSNYDFLTTYNPVYTNTAEWIIGMIYNRFTCLAYDYSNNQLGLGLVKPQ